MISPTNTETAEFELVTSLLTRSRRSRLKEELEFDFNTAQDTSSEIRILRAHKLRAFLDLGRIQYLNSFAFSLLLMVVFIGVARTESLTLLGLFVFLAIFQRKRKGTGFSSNITELFHQTIFFILFADILLSSFYGKELRGIASSEILLTLTATLVLLYVTKTAVDAYKPNRIDLRAHIWAERIHSLILFCFASDLLTGLLSSNPIQPVAIGTLGWVLILVLSMQKARPNKNVKAGYLNQ
jgi:hypothetical protein